MAKDGKKRKAGKKARKAERAAENDKAVGPKRKKGKGKSTRVEALRSTLTRPAAIATAAGAAVVAGLTGLWRARR